MKVRENTMRWRLALALGALLLGLLAGPRQGMAASQLCFPGKTQFCIAGRFLEYWQQNGGLEVFGYPLSAAQEQPNADTGQRYLTQQFERNRFELHPENERPYDVLLGRLGADQLRLGTGPAPTFSDMEFALPPEQRQPKDGCLWFPETRYNLCDYIGWNGPEFKLGFLSYWRAHGLREGRMDAYQRSLALLGYPISGLFEAYNSSGDYVLIQIFERARMEYHFAKPEHGVLLGRLGAEALNPVTGWQIVRNLLPASVAVYTPVSMPGRYGRPSLFHFEPMAQGLSYTMLYQGASETDHVGLILGQGFQGWDELIPPGEGQTEPLRIAGVEGSLSTWSRIYEETPVDVYVARWQSGGQTYRLAAESNVMTRAEFLGLAGGLAALR